MKTIKLTNEIKNDQYTEYVYESFDIQDRKNTEFEINHNLQNLGDFNWNIIVIYGGSGSGKSTILKSLGDVSDPIFDNSKALISNFDWLEPKEATKILSSVGLSSVPSWLRPFDKLSNGEQYRALIAYKLAKSLDQDIVLIDEFTSVVNRDVAKSMSFAIQKFIRKHNKRVVFASCHYDIFEWLMPDYILSPEKGGALEKCEYLRQGKPKIELSVYRCKSKIWDLFKKHHYLTQEANPAYIYLLFELNNKPIAINVLGIQVGKTDCFKSYRESRIVVLPDYQGMGIGSAISEFCAGISKNTNCNYYTKTSNPALGEYRNLYFNKWKPTGHNGKIRNDKVDPLNKYNNLRKSIHYCHKYIGKSINGFNDLLLPIDKLRYLDEHKHQLTLF